MKVFDDYSNYYDLLYRDKDYAAETDYIHSLIQTHNPGAKTILNLGCGTGKHDVLLMQKGYTIVAVDFSETMIEIARKNDASGKINFSVDDIRSLGMHGKFDVVISMFHVMSYQVEDSDLNATFQTAKKHLNPNGVFIFDCWNGPAVLLDPPHHRVKEVENEHLKIHRKTTPISLPEKSAIDVVFDISITRKEDSSVYELSETHRMRYLFPEELESFGNQTGFSLEASHKWLTVEPSNSDNWYSLYVFK